MTDSTQTICSELAPLLNVFMGGQMWRVRLCLAGGGREHVGYFANEEAGAAAYIRALERLRKQEGALPARALDRDGQEKRGNLVAGQSSNTSPAASALTSLSGPTSRL
jgi:hypothetical protein